MTNLWILLKNVRRLRIKAGAAEVSAYVKVVYKPEGDVLTIEKKITKHHQ